jgi:2-polyprenyl-3-methyl-5-hydroxy-6-metoxy-1,4-benzoquinol methylase
MAESETALLERIAREYQQPDPGRQVDRQFLDWTVERMLPWIHGPDVLELGFGDDQWTGKILDRLGRTHVVDASRKLLDLAQEKYGPRLRAYHSLFEEFCPDTAFDTIVASYVLEHVEDPVQVLTRAARWLKPRGHMLIVVPHADSLHRRLAVAMGMQRTTDALGPTDRQMGHRRVYTIAGMERDVRQAGLAIVRRQGFLLKPLPQGMMTGFPAALLEGFMKLGDDMPMEYASSIAFDCVAAAQ